MAKYISSLQAWATPILQKDHKDTFKMFTGGKRQLSSACPRPVWPLQPQETYSLQRQLDRQTSCLKTIKSTFPDWQFFGEQDLVYLEALIEMQLNQHGSFPL